MRFGSGAKLAVCVVVSVPCDAQFRNWQSDQVNTSICVWSQPRAALIRDTVYLDGGEIWWTPGLASGELGQIVGSSNPEGIVLSYNFSESFSKGSNVTGILVKDKLSKARGGLSSGISSEPSYYDGGMLANDAEFFLYGGALFANKELYDAPLANSLLGYRKYPYGPDKPQWDKGFTGRNLNDGVTRYIAYGGAVNAPSENKAWYFSGLTSPTRGPIEYNAPPNGTTLATNVSNTLIELDMAEQIYEKWSNITLPDNVKGRANPEVVWVPVGKQGILVVLGGVVYPEWSSVSRSSPNPSESKLRSPDFMRLIDIYDIANKEWYQQPTEGGPGTRTRGCAVVATAADKSSFNIYYYGGFDGIRMKDDFYDDVWVLSLPSFTWTLLNKGTPVHGRSGHKCFTPYPDQLMVIGGYTPLRGASITCLDQGPIVVFNLTSGSWMDGYSPSKYGRYGVHEKITANIGGTASGGATATAPLPSGWASKGLGEVFSTAYDTKKLKHYWPYNSSSSPQPTATTSIPDHSAQSQSNMLSIILPAVLVPVAVAIGIGVALWYFCVKKRRSTASSSASTAVESGLNIVNWVRGQGAFKRSMMSESPDKLESEASPASPDDLREESVVAASPVVEKTETLPHEMEDTQVSELCDTSSPAELHDTGFTPMSAFQHKFASFASEVPYSPSSPSQSNGQWGQDGASAASQSPNIERQWMESPMLANWSQLPSELATPHVSLLGVPSQAPNAENIAAEDDVRGDGQVSPETAPERVGSDYITAGTNISPLGRSPSGATEERLFHDEH